ncbi:ComEC/Rec2 family competence protein [Streptomyces sp. ME01-24h]|nr:ComEC/Rec2 family competence protein [Streptomyces sp. ME19-03-3]MDX3353267.1 ComEC/Rec2 family competence protein [Streptomyces sp. ME01-24h]
MSAPAPRPAVHAAAASPRGASNPRQEGPPDLRLVPPALAAWIAAGIALVAPGRVVAWACATAVLAALVSLARRWSTAATVALCAAASAAAAGLHAADLHRGPLPALAAEHAHARVELRLTTDPRPIRPQVRGAVRVPDAALVGAEAVRVTAGATTTAVRTPVLLIARQPGRRWLGLLPGTRVEAEARLAPAARPGDRVAAVLSVRGPPRVVEPPGRAQRVAGTLRAGLREATAGLPPDARALLPGLVVGDTSRIPVELHDAFEATDLTHLTAVSGSNLSLVLILLIGPPGLALRAERGGLAPRLALPLRVTAVLGGGLTAAFVVVCRPDPSVLRAAACGLITLLAIGTGRRRSLLPALCGAALALLLYDPWLARSYGFALSVLATGALLVLAPRWSAALRHRRVPPRLAEVLAAAAAAQAVCAPVVAVLAAHVSLVAVPCNLLAELAVGPATVLGFAALAAAPFAMPAAKALAWVAGWPAGWIAAVARCGAALPGATLDWPGTWAGALLLAVVTVVLVAAGRRLLRRPWLCAAAALLLVLAVVRPVPLPRPVTGWPPPGWRLVACDVGQGDALVLSAGGGSAVVVDTGPEPRLVDRCLRSLGVTEVPLLVLTHFHADHVAGLPGVLRGRSVGAIETTTLDEPQDQAAFVRRQAAAARVPVLRAAPGERRRVGSLDWRVLWPAASSRPAGAEGAVPDDANPNDASITLLVRTAGLTVVLLGDLEPVAQRGLLTAVPGLPRVDVLKVAHHGSAYQDPALLARLRPRLALVSCGAGNPYGHPSPRTLAALRAQGSTVLRTDRDGPVAVLGDRESLRAASAGPAQAAQRAVRGRRRARRPRAGPVRAASGADGRRPGQPPRLRAPPLSR